MSKELVQAPKQVRHANDDDNEKTNGPDKTNIVVPTGLLWRLQRRKDWRHACLDWAWAVRNVLWRL